MRVSKTDLNLNMYLTIVGIILTTFFFVNIPVNCDDFAWPTILQSIFNFVSRVYQIISCSLVWRSTGAMR